MFDPTQLPPHLPQQNFYQKERGFFSPSTVDRAIQDAINRYPQPMPRHRSPAVPPPWHRLPVPFQSPSGRKPGSPPIPKPPVKNKTGREETTSPELFNSTYILHPLRKNLSFQEDDLDQADSNQLFQEDQQGQNINQLPVFEGISPFRHNATVGDLNTSANITPPKEPNTRRQGEDPRIPPPIYREN